jgi:long-chain fatty acid transport protein
VKQAISFKLIIAAILSGLSFSLFASGFRLPESSIGGMALSNAVVANPDLPGALIYNPALMSAQSDPRLVNFGVINISLDAEVSPENGNPAKSNGKSNIQLPSFFYMSRLNDQLSWGVGLHTPFGLETKWPANTFSGFSDIGAGALEPEASKLELVNLTPNLSYKIDIHNSVAFGVNYYIVKKLVFNTQASQIDADGEDFGYTLAYHYSRGSWNFGATYRSAVETHVEGNITAGGVTADAEADIEFPKMLQIGVRKQVNNQWAIEFDVERTYWSSFDNVSIENNHPAPTIPNPIDNTNNWKNVNAYRLGISYRLNNLTQLYFGYTRDETPQPDNYYSARIPDADRQLVSAGFSHQLDSGWTLEGGIMLVMFDDRTIQNTTPFVGGESNGTTVYNGRYESEALLVGAGFTKTFAK